MQIVVRMVACVAGNPLKAWRGGSEPDDVWEEQTHSFDSLEAAVLFVVGLPEQTTTHVVIEATDDDWGTRIIFDQDRGDDLDAVTLDSSAPVRVPYDPDAIPEAPPLIQGVKK